uniref:Putative sulfotransferase domain contining protein n=1 Tax=viral metagenome TaxID=1070528 RepID=A0A6M3KK48_9ZZZZ
MNYIMEPIFVTGAARSGTSMTAGIISLNGAFGGQLSQATFYNKKGMFENSHIRDFVVKNYLRSNGWDPMAQNPLPDIDKVREQAKVVGQRFRAMVLKIIKDQGCQFDRSWFYKGAKMCLIWPIWNEAFPEAKWVIVRRNAEDIVRSCLRTGFMRAYKHRSGWLRWVAEHEKRFEEMHDARLRCREVWPQRMINGDFTEMQSVVNWLGLPWDLDKAREFIEPKLWARGNNNGE